uniref:Uncharacterized protein n=1 Tax=Picea sitchensis TaxID=3332 RepID=D5AE15_PICSI|nr:unknown [Picea sitchensis]
MAVTCSNSSLIAVVLILICSCCWIQHCESKKTAYEELEKHGFPVGLLPTSVKKYKLHDDGKFKVFLYSSCSFTVDSYHIYYERKFKGKIHTDIIKDLEGVTVKVQNYDLSIERVVRDGEYLNFYAGSYTASFPVTNFNESPECGCGFDCPENSTQLVQSA